MSFKNKFRSVVAFITIVCFSSHAFATPTGFADTLYHYARTNQIAKIRYLVQNMGYDINVKNDEGNTAWCLAKEQNNTYAMSVLAQYGANQNQRCSLPQGTIGTVAGVTAIGGIVAAVAGGGGGGDSSNSCEEIDCGPNAYCRSGVCECNERSDYYGTTECHKALKCKNGAQYGDICLCNVGYIGALCEDCDDGYEQIANGDVCQIKACLGFDIIGSCPENAQGCQQCQSGSEIKYKITNCKEGYTGTFCNECATGYENYANTMYFMYDVEGDNLIRKGFGMGITQFRSNYDDDSNREDLMVQAFVPISYIKESGLNFASIARFGYSDGEYERSTSDGKFESDLTSWVYGLSNALRCKFDLGYVTIEPIAELNILGYYQNRIREDKNKNLAIRAKAENNLSVEMGVGFNVMKNVQINEHSSLSFSANAMYYHEFSNPYHSLEASMYGMDGTYLITDYENIYDRDRAILSVGLDYNYKPFTIYGKFKQFIEDENPFEVNMGIKYNFQKSKKASKDAFFNI